MKRALFMLLLSAVVSIPSLSQDTADKADTKTTPASTEKVTAEVDSDQVYKEITIEDFETTQWTNSNISISVTKDQKAELQARDQYPAPIKDSKKYIGIKVYGKNGDVVVIKPPKELIITQHCKSISIWVYGKNFSGELSLLLQDANGKVHRLVFDKLNFLGWRKLHKKLSNEIAQEDKFLSQKRQMKILSFQYKPAGKGRLAEWNYFYMDDIMANVRDKYLDKQDDNW